MKYDPTKHHRRSIRLKGYDYTQPGAYFITICTHHRACLFGDVVGGVMRLNEYGEILQEEWFKTAVVRPYVRLYDDEFVVMPNHVHGVIWIVDDVRAWQEEDMGIEVGARQEEDMGVEVGARQEEDMGVEVGARQEEDMGVEVGARQEENMGVEVGARRRRARTAQTVERFGHPVPGSIPTIVRAYKSATTHRINQSRGTPGAPVWQRNYYENIIRNERSLERIRAYILNNHLHWKGDRLHKV